MTTSSATASSMASWIVGLSCGTRISAAAAEPARAARNMGARNPFRIVDLPSCPPSPARDYGRGAAGPRLRPAAAEDRALAVRRATVSLSCMPSQPRGPNFGLPALGVGVGLRRKHADQVGRERPAMRWFEFTPENYMSRGGRHRAQLMGVAAHYKTVCHGVGLGIGS